MPYSPPDDSEMTFAFDDWACGVILFTMLTCTFPFTEAALSAKRDLTLNIPDDISDGLSSLFLLESLSEYFSRIFYLSEFLSLIIFYVKDVVEILVGLLNLNAKGRVSVGEVLGSAVWLASERSKVLPETLSTLEMAKRAMRPREQVHSLNTHTHTHSQSLTKRYTN